MCSREVGGSLRKRWHIGAFHSCNVNDTNRVFECITLPNPRFGILVLQDCIVIVKNHSGAAFLDNK